MLAALFRALPGAIACAPLVVGCSLFLDTEQYVSVATAEPIASGGTTSGAGGATGQAGPIARFAVLGGYRNDAIRNPGVFTTDVTYGGFTDSGELVLWAAWTLPAPGRYVAGSHLGSVFVFGDPEDTNEQNALWSSQLKDGVLSPWRRASPPLTADWAAVAVSETDVIAIASDTGDHVGSDISLLSTARPDAWRATGVSLLTPRIKTAACLCQGFLFVAGGEVRPHTDPDAIAQVESASVTAQGVGPMRASADLVSGGARLTRTDLSVACGSQRVYVIGGDSEPYQEAGSVIVLSGVIGTDGTVALWEEEPRLLYPVGGAATIVAAGRLIVAGGYNASRLDSVSFAELDPAGHVLAWRAEGNPTLPSAARDAAAVSLELQ